MTDRPTDQLNDDVVGTDQPHDHDDHAPADQLNDDVVGTDQPHDHDDHAPADQATNHELSTLEDAAAALDITVNAVRQRLKRGTLAGVKTNTGWLVDLTAIQRVRWQNQASPVLASGKAKSIEEGGFLARGPFADREDRDMIGQNT